MNYLSRYLPNYLDKLQKCLFITYFSLNKASGATHQNCEVGC